MGLIKHVPVISVFLQSVRSTHLDIWCSEELLLHTIKAMGLTSSIKLNQVLHFMPLLTLSYSIINSRELNSRIITLRISTTINIIDK